MGYHIGLLLISALYYLAPEFIEEGRLYWLRSPLYIVENKGKYNFFYTDEEYNKSKGAVKGEITRAKGLGELKADIARESMFNPVNQRLDPITLDEAGKLLLVDLMGEDVKPRTDFIFDNIDFSTIRE